MSKLKVILQGFRGSLSRKKGFARNFLFMVMWQGANYLAPLITFPHLARTLEPAGYGQLGIYLLIAGYMTILSDWGTNYSGSRQIAQQSVLSGDIDEVFWNIFFLRLLVITVLLAAISIYLVLDHAGSREALLLISAWSIILGNALTVNWCLQGLERLDSFATAALVGRLITVPLTIFLVRRADQAWVAVAIQGLGGVAIGVTSLLILRASNRVKSLKWSWAGVTSQFREGAPVLISNASHGLYSSSATLCLGWFHGAFATGIFVGADRLRLACQGVIQPLVQVVYPRVSRLAVEDRGQAIRLIRLTALIQTGAMAVLCAVLMIFAPRIIGLMAGQGYGESVLVLRLLAPCVALFAANVMLGPQTLLPFGMSKAYGRINSLAALFNVSIMVPSVYFAGFVGAAVGVLLTEAFMLICYLAVIVRAGLWVAKANVAVISNVQLET